MNQDITFFVGLDLGDQFTHLALLDGEGNLMEESRLRTERQALRRRLAG